MIQVKAIVSKKLNSKSPAAIIDKFLKDAADDFQREMQEYPPQRPWRSRPPKRGPRAGGQRTGAYGRGWSRAPRFSRYAVTIQNNVGYAAVVGGPRSQSPGQIREMSDRGWKSVEDVATDSVQKHLPNFSEVTFATE